jgi:hypothetical protein
LGFELCRRHFLGHSNLEIFLRQPYEADYTYEVFSQPRRQVKKHFGAKQIVITSFKKNLTENV